MQKRFVLQRVEDESGISGTGVVAEGTLFTSGKVALAWVSDICSVTIYNSIEEVVAIHSHGGKTQVVWLDVEDDTNDGA